jgi:hypothetical protein
MARRSAVRAPAPAGIECEADLYPPLKAFLERQGYTVKGEVSGCDLVATRAGEPPTIVELKRTFSLELLLQGVDRLALTDRVYLAVPEPRRRRAARSPHRGSVRALCRRLGLGLITVAPERGGRVTVILDPVPYRPRKHGRRLARLLGEHARREGDPNRGGVRGVPLMTAYRQEALRCAQLIRRAGQATPGELRESGLAPNAAKILQRDVYGWFRRIRRGAYGISERAERDIARFSAAGTLPELLVRAAAD